MRVKKVLLAVLGCVGLVLACVWTFHILYFCFGVKTCPEKRAEA